MRGIDFELNKGQKTALVGESGCGKSMTALSVTRLAPTDKATITGEIKFNGNPIRNPHPKIAYIFQDPIASLNPVMRIGRQLKEACKIAGTSDKNLIELLASVDLPNPAAIMKSYPCELSGGMCQRVMIAMGLAREPELLIADEPTTALDVTTQSDVMDLIVRVTKEREMGLLMSTHNLGLVKGRCDSIHVLYAGQIVESGSVAEVTKNPLHPYTQGLLAAIPKIDLGKRQEFCDIPGTVPSPKEIATLCKADGGTSCSFRPRCKYATDACASAVQLIKNDCRACRCIRASHLQNPAS